MIDSFSYLLLFLLLLLVVVGGGGMQIEVDISRAIDGKTLGPETTTANIRVESN